MRAFVFDGSGARGSIQSVIALKLFERGIEPQLLIGSSSGAVNSVGFSYLGPRQLVETWRSIDSISDIFELKFPGMLWKNGLYQHGRIKKILDSAISNGHVNPGCQVVVTRANIKTGLVEYVSNWHAGKSEFLRSVLDAITIPGIVHAEGDFIDGAAAECAPVTRAIEMGADQICVILGQPPTSPIDPEISGVFGTRLLKHVEMGYRFIELLLFNLMMADLRRAFAEYPTVDIRVYAPVQQPNFGALDFDRCGYGTEFGRIFRDYSDELKRVLSSKA